MPVPQKPNTPVEEYLAAILAELARLNATMEALAQRASPARVVEQQEQQRTPAPASSEKRTK